jgi:uncharacterized protein (DUF2147 family)
MTTRSRLMLAVLLWFVVVPATADGNAILGNWATEPEDHGYAKVEITKENDRYFGKIVWLSEPLFPRDDERGMGGQPKIDRENPDESLRDRPIVGLRILEDFEYTGKSQWKRGTIYDPASGKTYKCNLKLQDDGSLKVRGYVGVSLLGRTTIWTRAEDGASN